MVKTRSLSHLALNPYRVVTNGRTDRIAIANSLRALSSTYRYSCRA